MTYRLEDIKVIRKKLGMTQTELAKRANVSQSLIAKIESGIIDPTFSNAQKIFDALSGMEKKHELIAADIMNPKIISISPDENIRHTTEKMRKFNISQLPVVDMQSLVGLVSESNLLDAITKHAKFVRDIMAESPPVVSKTASVNAVSSLLKYYPVILVSEKGRLIGLITKADLLEKVYGK